MSEPAAEIQEAELVEPSAELVSYEPAAPTTLYGTRDPKIALERMSELADALMGVVHDQKLAVRIRGREHLTVEAWQTLGALVGVHAAIAWTRPNENGDGILARAEARTLAGALVGAAEAECTRDEKRWKDAEPYAVRSMASTRAISRALQAPLRHIAVLAGYEGTTAEEVPEEPEASTSPSEHASPASEAQVDEISALLRSLEQADPERDWRGEARGIAGGSAGALSRGQATTVIKRLRERLKVAAGG